MKLDFYTSFYSENIGEQYNSWGIFANKIYAIQDKSENIAINCEKRYSPADYFNNKKFQKINNIIKIAQSQSEYFCLINNNIKIQQNQEKWEKITNKLSENSIFVGHRYDYNKEMNPILNYHNLDFFILSKKLIFKNNDFLMAQCDWDWYLLYLCLEQNFEVNLIDFPFLFCKTDRQPNNYKIEQNWFQEATNINWKESFIKFNLKRYLINNCKTIND